MLKQRTKRKERLKSTSSNCSNYEPDFEAKSATSNLDFDQNGYHNGRRTSSCCSEATVQPQPQPHPKLRLRRSRSSRDEPASNKHWMITLTCGLFSGILIAFLAIHLSEFYRSDTGRRTATFQRNEKLPFAGGHLPDIQHLEVVEESDPILMKRYDASTHEVSNTASTTDFVVSGNDGKAGSGSGDDAEALKSLSVALLLKAKKGQLEKARKVFMHAVALSPNNPKILNSYGEFLEEADHDVLEADHLYTKAMINAAMGSDEYSKAVANRHRTAALVDEIDGASLTAIDDKKRTLLKVSRQNPPAFRRAKKEAYFQHVYHTVAIEGNTMSLPQTRSILETRLAVGGKSVMEHNEVLGLDAALKYINQTLVDRVTGDIRMQDILEIHRRVIGYTDPTEAGMFRRTQVFVGDHIPPSADHIDQLMERFMLWLNSNEALRMHPVRMAALAHYKLVYIHPFVDGNGRTSRLLMNLILMHHGFPPVIVRKQDRLRYYQYLVTANSGDVRPFVRFIAECTERTLDAYLKAGGGGGGDGSSGHDLAVPFTTDNVETIANGNGNDIEKYEKVIMGGSIHVPLPPLSPPTDATPTLDGPEDATPTFANPSPNNLTSSNDDRSDLIL